MADFVPLQKSLTESWPAMISVKSENGDAVRISIPVDKISGMSIVEVNSEFEIRVMIMAVAGYQSIPLSSIDNHYAIEFFKHAFGETFEKIFNDHIEKKFKEKESEASS